jgi:hypothetical protein
MVDEYVKVNNRIQKPNANGPAFMVLPTIADLYDRAMHNDPIVGGLATLSAHLMMIGHGSQWNGGDKDIAVAREKEDAATGGDDSAVSWNLTTAMKPFYEMPKYVNDLPTIDRYNAQLDAMDGARDGKWRQNSIAQFNNGFDTPARTPFQTQLFEKVISEEGFGADDVPDLLYLNYKAIDVIGHAFSANGIEMSDALKVQDEHLQILIGLPEPHGREGNVGAGAHGRPRYEHRPRDLRRVPDRHRHHREPAEPEVRRRRQRAADRQVPHDRVLVQRERARPERARPRGRRGLPDEPHPGAGRQAHPAAAAGPRERSRVRRRLPDLPDGPAAVPP